MHHERFAYTPTEVADLIGVSTQTVYRMIHRGELGSVRVGSRNYRVPATAVTEFLDLQAAAQ